MRRHPHALTVGSEVYAVDSHPAFNSYCAFGTIFQNIEIETRFFCKPSALEVRIIFPSGDRFQPGSLFSILNRGSASLLPVTGSKRKNDSSVALSTWYRHTADGGRAHCMFPILRSRKTSCGGPPARGTRINRVGATELPTFGQAR